MITDGNDWHYLVVSSLSALLEGKLSNLHGYFYCLNSYTTKNRLKERDRKRCRIELPKWFEKTLKYNPGEKSLKAPIAIYLNFFLKMNVC